MSNERLDETLCVIEVIQSCSRLLSCPELGMNWTKCCLYVPPCSRKLLKYCFTFKYRDFFTYLFPLLTAVSTLIIHPGLKKDVHLLNESVRAPWTCLWMPYCCFFCLLVSCYACVLHCARTYFTCGWKGLGNQVNLLAAEIKNSEYMHTRVHMDVASLRFKWDR